MSVRSLISKTTRPNFTKLFVHVACGRVLVLLLWWPGYAMYFRFVNDVMFSHNEPYGASCAFLSGNRIVKRLKLLHRFNQTVLNDEDQIFVVVAYRDGRMLFMIAFTTNVANNYYNNWLYYFSVYFAYF